MEIVRTIKSAVVLGLLGVASLSVDALPVTPSTFPQWTGNQTSQSQINGVIAPIIGSATELYKQNYGGSEEKSLAGSYQTTFVNSADGPSGALIDHIGGAYVGGTAWLLVKDGNHSPAWYLFNLTTLGWNGTDDLQLSGFWTGNGAISHVTLYGTSVGVPDGGATAALLGMGLLALGTLSRKHGKRHAGV